MIMRLEGWLKQSCSTDPDFIRVSRMMKSPHFPALAIATCISLGQASAQTVVQQDFSGNTVLDTYFSSSSPTIGQLSGNQLLSSTTANLNSVPPADIISQSNGAATLNLVDGALEFSLLDTYRYYRSTFINDNTYMNLPSRGTVFVRSSLGSPAPTRAYFQFKVKISSSNGTESYTPALLAAQMGSGQDLVNLKHTGDKGLNLTDAIFGSAPVSTGEALITFAINNTATAAVYGAPNALAESLAADSFDVWINQIRVRNDVTYLPSTISNANISLRSGISQQTDSMPVSSTVGSPSIFRLDEFLLLRNLPPPPPTDTDRDGLPDFVETYFGTSPTIPNGSPLVTVFAGGSAQMTWPEAVPTSVVATPQWSPDQVTWLGNEETLNGIPARALTPSTPGGGQKRISLSGTGLSKAFLRLKLVAP